MIKVNGFKFKFKFKFKFDNVYGCALVLVCSLLNATAPAPCRRAWSVFRTMR